MTSVVLAALRTAGERGMTRSELHQVDPDYDRAIFELRERGHLIAPARLGCDRTYALIHDVDKQPA